MSDRIPPQEDLPALVLLLSEQIGDVKTSLEELKQGLSTGLRHLEGRLDDHALRLTYLERSEIRREEGEKVRAQMFQNWDSKDAAQQRRLNTGLSQAQLRVGWASIVCACVAIIASNINIVL